MNASTPLEWQDHICAGRQYLKAAGNGLSRPAVFTNELIYHLTAMAVEKLLVGLFQYYRRMPADHTLDGLVDELSLLCPLDRRLADDIKALGRFDDMCPLVPVQRSIPTDQEVRGILEVGRQVAAFAEQEIYRGLPQKAV